MAVAQLISTDLYEIAHKALIRRNPATPLKVAHNTHAHAKGYGLELTYHGNRILFKPYGGLHYEISNAGWHSVTTSGRLHQITRSNGGGIVNIKNGMMRYTSPSGTVHEMTRPLLIDERSGEVIGH